MSPSIVTLAKINTTITIHIMHDLSTIVSKTSSIHDVTLHH